MAETKPPKKKISLSAAWGEFRDLAVAHRGRLAMGLVLLLISRAASVVLPSSVKILTDEVLAKGRHDLLPWLATAVGVAALVDAAASFGLAQILGVAAQGALNEMRKVVQQHVLRLPVRYFDSTQTGKLISRIMTDAEGVRNLIGNGLVQLVGGLLTACVALGVLFWLNWWLTVLILVVLAVFGGCLGFAFTYLRPLFRKRGEINAEVTGRLNQTLGGVRIIKAYVAEPREARVFATGVDRLFANVRSSIIGVSAISTVSTVLLGAIAVLMITVGGHAVVTGQMTMGQLLMYLAFTAMVVGPVVQMTSIGTQISEAFAGLDRIRELRAMATEDADDAKRAPTPEIRGEVAFEQVVFEYNPGKPVLKDISFTVPAGTTTALVGSSGSGKSTLVSLVMAFNRPLSGTVRIDGRDLAELKLADYRRHLGVVMQDNFLFDGTVSENIAFSRPDATVDEIQAASRLAHCDDFVLGLEKGYDTVVGERGIKLSGGQRQRIAIARALLAQPRILILDEATSSLDSESEAAIQEGLAHLRQGRTTFVIAHRLSTIRSADQILVLEAGAIVERGTHAELIAANGRYRQLHDKQYRFESERFINPGEEHPSPIVRAVPVAT